MDIVDVFVENFHNNKDKPWKTSKIFRVKPKHLEIFEDFAFSCFSCFFFLSRFSFVFFFFLFSVFLLRCPFFFLGKICVLLLFFFVIFFILSFFFFLLFFFPDAENGKNR